MASRKPLTTASPRPTPVPVGALSSRSNGSNMRRFQLIRHTAAVVDDLQDHAARVRAGVQRRVPPGRGVGQRVGEQVGQHPLQQARVGAHQRQPVRHHPHAAGRRPARAGRPGRPRRWRWAAGTAAGSRSTAGSSSRLPIRASSRSADSSMVASSAASSAGVHWTSVCRSVLTLALIDASGVRRSWLTAASSAVRIRLPSASASACAAWVRSRSRSSAAAACAAKPSSIRAVERPGLPGHEQGDRPADRDPVGTAAAGADPLRRRGPTGPGPARRARPGHPRCRSGDPGPRWACRRRPAPSGPAQQGAASSGAARGLDAAARPGAPRC